MRLRYCELPLKTATGKSKSPRVRREPEATRTIILDTTEALMIEEGYAAVSTRRVAKQAGLSAALIHYYYATTDDLLIALHRRMTERQLGQLLPLLHSEDPLRALWQFQTNWAHASLAVEFMALANHRKAIREEIAACTERARDLQATQLTAMMKPWGVDPAVCPPICMAALVMSVARMLVNEEVVGITRGHAEVKALVGWVLDLMSEARAKPSQGRVSTRKRLATTGSGSA